MSGLVNGYGDVCDVYVSAFGNTRLSPEVALALNVADRRTKEGRKAKQLERDIAAIAEAQWLNGDELEVFG